MDMRIASAMATFIFATTAILPGASGAPLPLTKAEIQIGLCAPPERIVQALDLQPRGAPIDVWQFDDAALTLLERGVRLRVRGSKDGSSEFTLKVANQDCARANPELIPSGEGKCEYDVYGETASDTVSLTRRLSADDTAALLAGRVAAMQMLSRAQIRYLREVAGVWPLPPDLRSLGPIRVQAYRTKGAAYDIDVSELPAGEQYAEISRKVPRADAARAMKIMEERLSRAGVEQCAGQSSQAGEKLRSLVR